MAGFTRSLLLSTIALVVACLLVLALSTLLVPSPLVLHSFLLHSSSPTRTGPFVFVGGVVRLVDVVGRVDCGGGNAA